MRFCRTILFCFSVLSLSAQQLSFFKPDNLKQLPSSECYNIMQDSRGYIWFSTEGGLCRYNGNTVRVFGAASGLAEGATYTLAEDNKGKIWMTTSKNRILYLDREKDSMCEPPFSRKYAASCNKVFQQTYLLQPEGDSALWLGTQNSTARINLRTNKIVRANVSDTGYFNFRVKPWGLIRYRGDVPYSHITNSKRIHLSFGGRDGLMLSVPYTKNYGPSSRVLMATGRQGEYFIGLDDFFIIIHPDGTHQVMEFGHEIICLYTDQEHGLWIGFYKGGMLYFPDGIINSHKISIMPGLSVSGVCVDAEKGTWCTTLEKGVFYCRNKYVLNYANVPGLDRRMEFLKAEDDRLYTSSEKKELIEIRKDSIIKHHFAGTLIPTDMLCYGDTIVVSGKSQIMKCDTSFRKEALVLQRGLVMGTNQLAITPDKRIFSINWTSLVEIIGLQLKVRILLLGSRARTLFSSRAGRLLVGCSEGLYEIDQKTYLMKKIPGITGSVSRIIETASDGIWIATKEHGLYVLEKESAKKISDLLRLPTEHFNDIAQDRRGYLWLASNIGLIRLGKPFGKQNTKIYNVLSGLNSTEILHTAATDTRIFISTYEGLCSFPLDCDLSNTTSPQIYVQQIRANENPLEVSAKPTLAWNENTIRINYDVLTFRRAGLPAKLFYRIEGLDNRLHYTEGRELLLNNLAPGTYKVIMYALNNDGKPGMTPAIAEFTIKKPFWLTPLFIIASLLVFVALVFVIVNRIIIGIQEKEEEKTRVNKLLAEYQMSALRAQMNPHFIFNCINSIQRYILTNRAEEAYNYLVKFSKLIRLVLNYSNENLISLAQELEIVELYIELEQLRFENKFSYHIKIGENIDVNELSVPVMIMQPYIENAIWHGLMNLDKGITGHIHIRLSLENHLLQVVIEDNGIGLEKAERLRKKGHKSKGTQINRKRAEILNIMSSEAKGSVLIENIMLDGKVMGTRVTIDIPINQFYE